MDTRKGDMMNSLLQDLQEPFPPEAITWKPGNTTKDGAKCMAMAYADFRAYMNRLDAVCGLDWSVRYVAWGDDRIMCELTVSGVTRTSTGEFGAQDEKNNIEGTVAEAQAFKRACAMFGLGRYLYDLPSVWVEFDNAAKKISKAGQTELDNRYKAWYQKAMAAAKKTPRQVDTSTGEIVHSLPDKADVETNGDVIFATEQTRPLASQSLRNKMHAIAIEYYRTQGNWDKKRPEWVRDATGGAYESSNDLSPENAEWIIEKLQTRIAKRAQQAAQQPEMA
jgi:hypothetical protein